MFILASMIFPRMNLVIEKAHQAKARNQLGVLRSAMNLYHTENEGHIPFVNYGDGTAEFHDVSLSTLLVPRYINVVPTPELYDGIWFNGLNIAYDVQAKVQMNQTPPREIILINGPPAYQPLTLHPYVYDPSSGNINYNNGNRSLAGEFFFDW